VAHVVTLNLDDETGQYLERLAAGQGRTPAEVAAWILTDELRRERCIDGVLLARFDTAAGQILDSAPTPEPVRKQAGA
jgi:predicted transcriptional regulator